MAPAEPDEDERRQWWWQRRPPADHAPFARGVWWAGHVQLFVAAALVLVCAPLFVIGVAASADDSAGSSAALLSRRLGEVQGAILGLAMAGPFVLSGKMLRASSGWRVYSRKSIGGGPLRRFLALASTVVGIALLSIVLTAGCVWALVPAIDVIVYLSGG